jgi:cytochrome c553
MTLGTADPKLVTLGEQIYRGGVLDKNIPACSACHGPQGEGNPQAGFPRLGGQHADYIVAQLQAYKNNQRRNDINNIMRMIAEKLSPQDMQSVASYIQGLH